MDLIDIIAERVERRECWVGFATCGCEVPKIEKTNGREGPAT